MNFNLRFKCYRTQICLFSNTNTNLSNEYRIFQIFSTTLISTLAYEECVYLVRAL